MLRKIKIIVLIITSLAFSIVIVMCSNLLVTRIMTKEYNMISLDEDVEIQKTSEKPSKKLIQLNDITMSYYELGEGYPLVLVHGNGGNYEGLLEVALYLANNYKVYLIESRCHGESSITNVINYDLMAKDLKEFIISLHLNKPIMIGHSDGGINALVTAINYPDLLGGLVSFGANTSPKEFKWYFTLLIKVNNLFNKSILNDMMLNEPNITKEQLQSIQVPSFIVAGEYDIVKLKDTINIANNIHNSEYVIVKGANHSNYVHNGKKCYQLIEGFINKIAK